MLKTLEPEMGIKCSICGQTGKKLKFRSFQSFFGIIIWIWRNEVTGYMCMRCSSKYMIKYTLLLMIPLSPWIVFFGPYVFISNLYNLIAGRFRIDEFNRQMLLNEEDISSGTKDFNSLIASRYKDLGDRFWSAQEFENAASAYVKAFDYGSEEIGAYLNYSKYWYQKKNFDEVMRVCTKILELAPDCAEAYQLRGLTLCNTRDPTQALNDFNRAEELGSDAPELYFNRAILLEAEGDVTKAISDFETVLEKTSEGKIRKDAEKRLRKLRK